MTSALTDILTHYRATSQTEREKGTYFEELICNDRITIRDIPLAAYDYIVNGKPARAYA